MKTSPSSKSAVSCHLDGNGCFVIEDYNQSKPFSNFFPGVAGAWGIPMWVFYVNRGQCVSSFGIEGKDKSLLEFQPANKAYRLTSLQGFRTFLKIKSGRKQIYWEPFQNAGPGRQILSMTAHDLTIEDTHPQTGVAVRVNYFTVPGESFPALARRVTVTNNGRVPCEFELVDGLPVFMPYGISEWVAKNMCRTVEAWVKVYLVKEKTPFYHLKVEVADTPAVKHIREGNFYVSFQTEKARPRLLDMIVENACVFGQATDYVAPQAFLSAGSFRVPARQQTSNRMPSAMTFLKGRLPGKGGQVRFASVIGHAQSRDHFAKILRQITQPDYLDRKARENQAEIDRCKQFALTVSSSPEYSLYCGQTFLDNVLRGGLPVSLKTGEGTVTLNIFSRKHGDLERDYNSFVLAPTWFSQGNGNYRDVNQNRRNDVWFNPDVNDANIVNFLSLVQADGYNPLIVKGLSFSCQDADRMEGVLRSCLSGDVRPFAERLKDGLQPGELLHQVAHSGLSLKVSPVEFLSRVLEICHKQEKADHGEGFWVDHWAYNLDLIESYLAVYPERLRRLLLERKVFGFYHNSHYVLPRDQRYLLTKNGVRQYHSVKHGSKEEIRVHETGNKLRTQNGQGEVYQTTLMAKLLCLAANKAATLDPGGIGIEMEADKPSWYDALNGLPGLLGSSLCETFELKRLCLFILDALKGLGIKDDATVHVYAELAAFIHELKNILGEPDPLTYWNKANTAKEQYRAQVRQGISGNENHLAAWEIVQFLNLIIQKIDRGLESVKDRRGLFPTYFYYEVLEHETLDKWHHDCPYVRPLRFKRHDLPLFLEGFVHALRVVPSPDQARRLYQTLRKSELFDTKLKMYKVNAGLADVTEDIGRASIFPPGWLENESIWLHMEYKYLLELLRAGLPEEFYTTFRDVLVPFLKPKTYGRSTLENSSFIVSSAHEDAALHGQGFVARLSGSTAEFTHMWLWMNVGRRPFRTDGQNQIVFRLEPTLPGWLFTKKVDDVTFAGAEGKPRRMTVPKDGFAFMFLGSIPVIYRNPKRLDTYGAGAGRIREIRIYYPQNNQPVVIKGPEVPSPHALDIRNRLVERIEADLG
ncbi:MAG: hypothetical protein Q8Q08_01315 [Candidatus Omnitrophota bacterium]|nr:hypothetical protein [Candidatus Omnitrophota bacterium]MDZ4241598.1 hypothetical protein [Candidatus Omnitrophota bacterium]